MQTLKQSESTAARRRILVYLVDATDGFTPEPTITVSAGEIKISKNGASTANHAGTWTEISLGMYHYEFTAGELDTLGVVIFNITKTGCRVFVKESQVVPWDPYLNQDADLTALQADATAIKAKTDTLPASPAAVGSAMTLTSGERDSIASAHLDLANGVETGLTVRNAHRLEVAAAAGKISGAATTTVTLRNAVADSKNRMVATVDLNGNRSAITTDLS